MENDYLDFIISLQQMYLENQDMDCVLASIDEQTSWIGTGSQEICKNFSEAAQALFLEKREYSGGFSVINNWYETRMIDDNICIVFGEFLASPKDKTADVADLHHRISAFLTKTDNGIKLLHLHMSVPDDDQENGEYYVKTKVKTDNQSLRIRYAQTTKDLHDRSQQLEILTENIPGGVHKCKNDPSLTLVDMSSGFLSMFGYTRDEIKSIFGDSFTNMIYDGDRAVIQKAMNEQLSVGTTVEFEYRVQCKDGSLIWIFDRGSLVTEENGEKFFYCMMMDITNRKSKEEELRLALERHEVIMNQATDIIFEWNIEDDTINFSSNWEKRFGYLPIEDDISNKIPMSSNIYKDDMPSFIKIMSDTAAGKPYSEAEFRIRSISDEYKWCRIRATAQFDSYNKVIKAVGVIVDIDQEKKYSNVLMEAAQRDALTQLYNKSATKSRIEKVIADKSCYVSHALMIIDVDNFKSINDRFGHQCGDAVLSNMANVLRKLFRTSDVVGRIGGDEFLVFVGHINSREFVASKANEIVRIFSNLPVEIGGDLSCSVGISIYPNDGEDYASLTRCADKALYGVKHGGKTDYAFYDNGVCEDITYSSMRTAINGVIDSEENDCINFNLVQYVFQMLYMTSDIEVSINHILQTVGTAYEVSRAYIFENSDDGKFCSNTFEWCNDGINPEIDNLKNLSFEDDLAGFFDVYDENGVFYCQDIKSLNHQLRTVLEPQGVVSVLQCFIKDGNTVKGYIGFDECGNNRYWTKEQSNTLSFIANVLSTFLVKQRLKEQLSNLR